MGSVAASMQHCYRERNTHNADQERTPDNQHLVAKSTDEAMGKLRALLPEKRRKDAVLAVEYVMTASPEWFAQATPEQEQAFSTIFAVVGRQVRSGSHCYRQHSPGRDHSTLVGLRGPTDPGQAPERQGVHRQSGQDAC